MPPIYENAQDRAIARSRRSPDKQTPEEPVLFRGKFQALACLSLATLANRLRRQRRVRRRRADVGRQDHRAVRACLRRGRQRRGRRSNRHYVRAPAGRDAAASPFLGTLYSDCRGGRERVFAGRQSIALPAPANPQNPGYGPPTPQCATRKSTSFPGDKRTSITLPSVFSPMWFVSSNAKQPFWQSTGHHAHRRH